MSTYIGKVQIGNQLVSIGSTLYGICSTASNANTKIVILPDFDAVFHGITIFVRFTNGNSVSSNVQIQIGNGTYPVLGNCICNSGEILNFTFDKTNQVTEIETTDSTQWHWISSGIAHDTIEIATTTPSAINTTANIGNSIKYAKEDHVHNIVLAEGTTDGTVKIAGTDVPVHGLQSGAYADINNYAQKNNPTFTGTVIIPSLSVNGTYADTVAVNKGYVDAKIAGILAGADGMTFKGTIGAVAANPTITSLPDGTSGHTYVSGDTYRVVGAAGYEISGTSIICEEGDLIIAIANSENNQNGINPAHWTIVQNNVDSAVYKGTNQFIDGNIIVADGTNGQVKDGGIAIPSNANFNNTSYQYTLSSTTANSYTGIAQAYDSTNSNSKLLVSVNQGILTIEEGITFSTTATLASAALNESAVAAPTLTSNS